MLLQDAQRASEEAFLEEQMLQDKLRAADWENTEDDMLREVAHKSFVEYLHHQGELAQSSKPVRIRKSLLEHKPRFFYADKKNTFVQRLIRAQSEKQGLYLLLRLT